MSLTTRLAHLEARAPAARVRFVWLDRWASRAGVTLDGVSYPRAGDETDEQLVDRAIEAANAAYPGERLMVFSWR